MSTVTWQDLADKVNTLAESRGEWAGAPIPLPGMDLVIEQRYPVRLDDLHFDDPHTCREDGYGGNDDELEVVAQWECHWLHATVYHYRENGGKVKCQKMPWAYGGRLRKTISVLDVCNNVWRLGAEMQAMESLERLITPTAFKQYAMTGMFIESSKRSGIAYVFRRLRPTIALSGSTGEMRALCCLCLHPIGYYKETWAGAMVPTDDVVAHLLMKRGNEAKYWAKANQIPVWRPEAGVY